MNSLVRTPCFNDRLAIVFGQTKAIDKSLKFASNLSSFSSDIFRQISSSPVAGKGLDALVQSFNTMRNGVKIFDAFRDLSLTSNDIHEYRMQAIQLICFTIADVVNPILYFEAEGFYTISNELKTSMGTYCAKIGLFGLATNLIHSIYQLYTSLKTKSSVDNFFQEEAIGQQIEQLNVEKCTFFNKMQDLKKNCKELEKSIKQIDFGIIVAEKIHNIISRNDISIISTNSINLSSPSQKPHTTKATKSITTEHDSEKKSLSLALNKALVEIKKIELSIKACEESLLALENYTVGQRYVNERFNQSLLSLLENILEISGLIISLAGISTIAIPATTIISLLGVMSSVIALKKMWSGSLLTENEEQKYQILINHVKRVNQSMADVRQRN